MGNTLLTNEKSEAMANAVGKAFGRHAIWLESYVFRLIMSTLRDEEASSLDFLQLGDIGVWVPVTSSDTVVVECMGLQCDHKMTRTTYGAALTLMAVNHKTWEAHRQQDEQGLKELIDLEDALKDLVFAEGSEFCHQKVSAFLD